jgi:UDP-N-acetylmuramate: L-alanyl-gamma-D-glutamyl-meso-diaminopimelate ligase
VKIHFIGICGTAMATLAALLRQRGHDVRGSDQGIYPPMDAFLAREGIPVLGGYKAEHITPDLSLVVVGNAISRGNPELEEVLDRKIRYCSLPEALREHFLWGARSIVIAGTHGKTTTTSLVGWLLTAAGIDPTVFVGGIALNFGEGGASYRLGHGREFVLEGDEYDSAFFDKTAKFLKYLPDIAVIGNIEFDHADIYADLEAVRLAFRRLAGLVPRSGLLLIGADSPDAAALRPLAVSPVESFGLHDSADWRAYDVEIADGRSRFKVEHHHEFVGAFDAPMMGLHNVRNCVGAIAVGMTVGVTPAALAEGLRTFRGVKRRLEVVDRINGITLYDDFAHHPTAVAETLAAVRSGHPGRRVWAVFEPRSASSCRRVFQKQFADAFAAADCTVLASVFRSSLPEAERLSVGELVADLNAEGRTARHIADTGAIIEAIVADAVPGDVIVVMSNGGFDNIHRRLAAALRQAHAQNAVDADA